MPDTGISIIWGGVAAAVVTAIAAIGSATIARQVKISEFRQKWIDALRDDIADYISKADEWMDIYEDINATVNQEEKLRKIPKANEARYKTAQVLRRIKLRFNPLESSTKQTDDAFLHDLTDLIDPGKFPPDPSGIIISRAAWSQKVQQDEDAARRILKREWEVTKYPPCNLIGVLRRWMDCVMRAARLK